MVHFEQKWWLQLKGYMVQVWIFSQCICAFWTCLITFKNCLHKNENSGGCTLTLKVWALIESQLHIVLNVFWCTAQEQIKIVQTAAIFNLAWYKKIYLQSHCLCVWLLLGFPSVMPSVVTVDEWQTWCTLSLCVLSVCCNGFNFQVTCVIPMQMSPPPISAGCWGRSTQRMI